MISKYIKERIDADAEKTQENENKKTEAQVKEQTKLYSVEQIELRLENNEQEGWAWITVHRAHETNDMYVIVDGMHTKEQWADIANAIRKLSNE